MSSPQVILDELMQAALAAAAPAGKFASHPPPEAKRVIVLGAGKAAASMAAELEHAWQRPLEGLVVAPYGHLAPTSFIEVAEAAHPVPDAAGEKAAERIMALAQDAGADDHVVFLGSGGASSLLVLPASGISLADKQAVGAALLDAGAEIGDFNTVRRMLSAIKGGRLLAACAPAPVTSFLISDVPGDDPAVIGSGPTIAQPCSAAAAIEVLDRYEIAVDEHITAAMHANEIALPTSPGELHLIVKPADALTAAAAIADEHGLEVLGMNPDLTGDAKVVGREMARQAQSLRSKDAAAAVILSGGELTAEVRGSGKGGCNHEFLLALALELDRLDATTGIHALAIDTDGCDGNSKVAGARIDPELFSRAAAAGLDPQAALAASDSHTFFSALEATIDTGPTLTNVNDFRAVLVLPDEG